MEHLHFCFFILFLFAAKLSPVVSECSLFFNGSQELRYELADDFDKNSPIKVLRYELLISGYPEDYLEPKIRRVYRTQEYGAYFLFVTIEELTVYFPWFKIRNAKKTVILRDDPQYCLKENSTDEVEIIARDLLMKDFGIDKTRKNTDIELSQDVKICMNYKFNQTTDFRCCFWDSTKEIKCYDLEENTYLSNAYRYIPYGLAGALLLILLLILSRGYVSMTFVKCNDLEKMDLLNHEIIDRVKIQGDTKQDTRQQYTIPVSRLIRKGEENWPIFGYLPIWASKCCKKSSDTINEQAEQSSDTINVQAKQSAYTINVQVEQSAATVNEQAKQSSDTINVKAEQSAYTINVQIKQSSATGNEQTGQSSATGNEQAGESSATGNEQAGESSATGNEQAGESSATGNEQAGESSATGNEQAGESAHSIKVQVERSSDAVNVKVEQDSSCCCSSCWCEILIAFLEIIFLYGPCIYLIVFDWERNRIRSIVLIFIIIMFCILVLVNQCIILKGFVPPTTHCQILRTAFKDLKKIIDSSNCNCSEFLYFFAILFLLTFLFFSIVVWIKFLFDLITYFFFEFEKMNLTLLIGFVTLIYIYDCLNKMNLELKYCLEDFESQLDKLINKSRTFNVSDQLPNRIKDMLLMQVSYNKKIRRKQKTEPFKQLVYFFDSHGNIYFSKQLFYKCCSSYYGKAGHDGKMCSILCLHILRCIALVLYLGMIVSVVWYFDKLYDLSNLTTFLTTFAGGLLPKLVSPLLTLISTKSEVKLREENKRFIRIVYKTIKDFKEDFQKDSEQGPSTSNTPGQEDPSLNITPGQEGPSTSSTPGQEAGSSAGQQLPPTSLGQAAQAPEGLVETDTDISMDSNVSEHTQLIPLEIKDKRKTKLYTTGETNV
ncbi:uncharacterized protein LOC131945162 [Physella acuta]|uniref:uncharacterized protein LOC131945162 n=1 Tax=Physella acuta TaxID=109671 RepID=UPI0027DD234E|nr:uncharacterized protein LOC131945162 [Physella acuta]